MGAMNCDDAARLQQFMAGFSVDAGMGGSRLPFLLPNMGTFPAPHPPLLDPRLRRRSTPPPSSHKRPTMEQGRGPCRWPMEAISRINSLLDGGGSSTLLPPLPHVRTSSSSQPRGPPLLLSRQRVRCSRRR